MFFALRKGGLVRVSAVNGKLASVLLCMMIAQFLHR
jgi:hypothetical protein